MNRGAALEAPKVDFAVSEDGAPAGDDFADTTLRNADGLGQAVLRDTQNRAGGVPRQLTFVRFKVVRSPPDSPH